MELFTGEPQTERLVIIDPEGLHHKTQDKAYSKRYKRYKRTYSYGQSGGKNLLEAQRRFLSRGKKFRCWRLVLSHSDFSMDEYVPVFSKGGKKSHKNRENGRRGRSR